MNFSILLFMIFVINVRSCFAVIYTLKIGDPVTCGCLTYYNIKREISWTLQKVNGEKIPLITNCPYPYNNCSVQNYKGDIFLEVNKTVNKITVQHVKQDMLRLLCSPDYFREYTDNCILNVVDSFGATSIDSTIHTLNQGDQFTCNCNLYGSQSLEWFLQKVNGEKISLVTTCHTPYNRCVIWYNPTNFELQTSRMWGLNLYQSNLTVKHVDRDMLRVFCSSDFFQREQDRCLMNVVDYVRSDNVTTKSSTHAPDVYFNTYPEQPFLTTPFQFLFPTTPEPAAENYASSVALKITVIVLPFIALFVLTILAVCCCCRKKKLKRLQRQNQAIRVIINTPQLTPAMVLEPDQNYLSTTRVNQFVHPSNSPLTTESQQHTTSIQSTAPKDLPPPYSSLLELKIEPPPYTTLTDESYNRDSAPSHQAQNVPPPHTTRYTATYNSVSPSVQQQATTESPPPYSVWHTS